MKFLFYDVETATSKRIGSICAVGWCLVEHMSVIDHGYSLINPNIPFSSYNSRLHGIKAKDVHDSPTFSEYWHNCLGDLMRNCVVVAHGAEFDIRSTEQALFDADIPDDGIDYFDFLPVAEALIPDCENHRLNTLADWAGISFCHHCASEDCCSLFEIAKTLCSRLGYDSLEEMFIRARCTLKSSTSNSFQPRLESPSSARTPHISEYRRRSGPVAMFDESLSGCSFCVTGNVGSYGRDEVEGMILSHGGQFKTSVSRKLTFLVVGPYGDDFPEDYISGKHKEALALIDQGYPIQIITAEQFLDIMDDPASSPLVLFASNRKTSDQSSSPAMPETAEEIEDLWNQSVSEPEDDSDAFSHSPTQNGFSFFVYGRKSFELIRAKKGMNLRVCSDLHQLLNPHIQNVDEDKFYTLPPDQLSSLFQILKDFKHQAFRNLITDTFACCSSFQECSDARACLHPHDRTYNGCYYRRNLEKGLIFYGKNRNADENGMFKDKE